MMAIALAILALLQDPRELAKSAEEKEQKGDLKGALADINQAIKLHPESLPLYQTRARIRRDLGDYDGSIADATKIIDGTPLPKLKSQVLELRAFTRMAKGDLDGAVADLTKAIESDPQEWLYHSGRAAARLEKGDPGGALTDAEAAVKLSPKNTTALVHRGRAKACKGDLTGGLADLDAALKLDPTGMTWALRYRSMIHQLSGNWKDAAADLRKGQEADKDFAWSYGVELWCVAIHAGGGADALRDLKQYATSIPEGKTYDWIRALYRYLIGDLNEQGLRKQAAAEVTTPPGVMPATMEYYVGMRCLAAGDKAGAAKAFKASLAVGLPGLEACRLADAELQRLK